MKKFLYALPIFVVLFAAASILQPENVFSVVALPVKIITIVDHLGTNIATGTASAVTAPPTETVQVVNSSNQVLDTLGGGGGGGATLPSIPGTAGYILSEDATNALWEPCAGDAACSTLIPGSFTITGIQGRSVKSTAPSDAQLYVWNGTNGDWEPVSLSQDVTITNAGVATVGSTHITGATTSKLAAFNASGNLVNYAGTSALGSHQFMTSLSATGGAGGAQPACSDLTGAAASCGTNATELVSGTVAAGRGGAGANSGILKANGSGTVSAAVAGTDYAAATTGAANTPLFNNGTGGFTNGTRSGNTTTVGTTSGTLTSGDCAKFDAAGNIVDQGAACNTGGGGLTLAGSSGNLQTNNGAGNLGAFAGSGPLASHNFATMISASGALTGAQPACVDLSDSAASCNTDTTNATNITSGNMTRPPAFSLTNNATGPTLNKLVTLTSGQATIAPSATASGIQGICISNCANSGSSLIQYAGLASCVFDASSAITSGHYVTMSQTTAGDCADAGTTQPVGTPTLGTAYTSGSASTTQTIQIGLPMDSIGSASGVGTISAYIQLGNPAYYGTSGQTKQINPLPYIIHAGTGTIYNAFAQVPQNTWASSTNYSNGSLLEDSNGNTERLYSWPKSTVVATGVNIRPIGSGGTGNVFRATTGGTTAASEPSWGSCSTTCSDNTVTWTNEGTTGTSGSGSHPTWPTTLGNTVNDGSGATQITWQLVALGAFAPSAKSVVILDPNQSYSMSGGAVLIGLATANANFEQVLINNGASVTCSTVSSSSNGFDCIVEGNKGHIVSGLGEGNTNSSFSANSSYSGDSTIESYAGYLCSRFSICDYIQPNMDVQGISFTASASATINKATLWISSIEGQGIFRDLSSTSNATSSTGILVDDVEGQWNEIEFDNVYEGMHAAKNGVDIECGTTGGQSVTWFGGAVTDTTDTTDNPVNYFTVNGSGSHSCKGIVIQGPYFEGSQVTNTHVNGLQLNYAASLEATGLHFNGGGGSAFANAVNVVNSAAGNNTKIHVAARCDACTNQVTNATTSFSTGQGTGTFDYHYTPTGTAGITGDIFDGKQPILGAAPTISSGFGSTPSIVGSNGTGSFEVNVGTGGTASSGVIGLPTAPTGWSCQCTDITTNSTSVFVTKQTASATTSCTVGNFSDAAAATAWTASDKLYCHAFSF